MATPTCPSARAPAAAAPAEAPGLPPVDQLFAQHYAELHRLARSRLQQAQGLSQVDTTAVLHDAFLRLRQAAPTDFADPQGFLAYVAKAMRSVVVDLVRSRQSALHGGGLERVTWRTELGDTLDRPVDEVLQVSHALDALARLEPRLATTVELRYFGGLTEAEVAEVMGLTLRTVQRDWAKARLFLSQRLQP